MKDRVGRNRYIAFQIDGGADLQSGEVNRALREAFDPHPKEARPWLVHLRDGRGVVRVSHLYKDTAISLLRSLKIADDQGVRVRTLGTSGTIRGAVRKYLEPSDP
ncbi:MAG: Rpp14/Pop5 family protein [Thermoplasmata archaeon]